MTNNETNIITAFKIKIILIWRAILLLRITLPVYYFLFNILIIKNYYYFKSLVFVRLFIWFDFKFEVSYAH